MSETANEEDTGGDLSETHRRQAWEPGGALLDSQRPETKTLVDLVRTALYRDFPFREVADTTAKRKALIEFVHHHNSTLRAVASLCAVKSGDTFLPNSKIAGVVNFNVDSILRNCAHARYRTWLFKTVKGASATRSRERIPVYQMHGFIAYTENQQDEAGQRQECVFTEQQYFDFFNRPHSVFNYTFLYLLREYQCLFVGMSMLDDNIRRLLHYSTKERRYVLSGGSSADGKPDRKALRHFAIMKRSGSRKVDDLMDISLRRLGTLGLWIDDHSEIPDRLGYIYQDSEIDWDDVY